MNEALQSAIDNLQIMDVFLRSAKAWLADDFEPKYEPDPVSLVVQFKHLVKRSDVLELKEGDQTRRLFRVHMDLGARWGVFDVEGEKNRFKRKAHIEGTMVAEYLMIDDPGEEALTAFAIKNASYHIWPYWREHLSSQCLRMNLPKLTLPAIQFARNGEDADREK
jgi:hypothetical protein